MPLLFFFYRQLGRKGSSINSVFLSFFSRDVPSSSRFVMFSPPPATSAPCQLVRSRKPLPSFPDATKTTLFSSRAASLLSFSEISSESACPAAIIFFIHGVKLPSLLFSSCCFSRQQNSFHTLSFPVLDPDAIRPFLVSTDPVPLFFLHSSTHMFAKIFFFA